VRLRATARRVSAERATVTFEAWRDAPRAQLSRFEIVAQADVLFASSWPAAPAPLPALGALLVHDGSGAAGRDFYRDGWLFHGPALEVIREARWDRSGLSGILNADPGALGLRAVNPRLLDGMMQAMPHDGFALWAAGVPADRTGFPSRVVSLLFHGPVPSSGTVRIEARYGGPAEADGNFQRVSLQSIAADGTVWCSAEVVVVLVSRGRLGAIQRADRRAFARRERAFPPLLSTSLVSAETGERVTSIATRDVGEADFVRGSVAALYGAPPLGSRELARLVAMKEHLGAQLGIHPALVDVDSASERIAVTPTADGWCIEDRR
jgi:hypothetical protein